MKNTAGKLAWELNESYGSDIGFLANVILTREVKPVTRLRNLARLLVTHNVRSAPFDCETILAEPKSGSGQLALSLANLDRRLR